MNHQEETSDKVLMVRDLTVDFLTYEGTVKVLDGINFELKKGEVLGIVGETGCGKSVTAQIILRLIPTPPAIIKKGEVLFFTKQQTEKDATVISINLLEVPESSMREIRGSKISMIFQEPMTALNPTISIGEHIEKSFLLHQKRSLYVNALKKLDMEIEEIYNSISKREKNSKDKLRKLGSWIKMMLYKKLYRRYYMSVLNQKEGFFQRIIWKFPILRGCKKWLKEELRSRTVELLRKVKIPMPEEIVNRYPHELSGGMRQRVMIAMAVACNPDILIADEPTTALDVTTQAEILRLIDELKSEIGCSIIYISHDLGVISEICNRIAVMYAGVIVETGKVEDILNRPLHPYTHGLIKTRLKPGEKKEYLDTIPGMVPSLINPPTGCRFHPRCQFAMDICKKSKPIMIDVGEEHSVSCHLYGSGDRIHV